jgi:soluble lytic murein transglycosylase-like protein
MVKRLTARHLLTTLAAAAALLTARPAAAQIYTWTDANGHMVLSDHPQDGTAMRVFAVPKAEDTVRVTRFVSPDKSALYDPLIREHAELNGVRPDLVRAVVQVESAYNPYARSPKGALGLMQLMPATMREFGVRNPFNPIENIRAGVSYLRQLLDRYSNDEALALAAYNAGPGAVDRHGTAIPPYKETRDYVTKVHKMAGTATRVPGTNIYKTTETVDGREVPRYTDHKPEAGSYEVVKRPPAIDEAELRATP